MVSLSVKDWLVVMKNWLSILLTAMPLASIAPVTASTLIWSFSESNIAAPNVGTDPFGGSKSSPLALSKLKLKSNAAMSVPSCVSRRSVEPLKLMMIGSSSPTPAAEISAALSLSLTIPGVTSTILATAPSIGSVFSSVLNTVKEFLSASQVAVSFFRSAAGIVIQNSLPA